MFIIIIAFIVVTVFFCLIISQATFNFIWNRKFSCEKIIIFCSWVKVSIIFFLLLFTTYFWRFLLACTRRIIWYRCLSNTFFDLIITRLYCDYLPPLMWLMQEMHKKTRKKYFSYFLHFSFFPLFSPQRRPQSNKIHSSIHVSYTIHLSLLIIQNSA